MLFFRPGFKCVLLSCGLVVAMGIIGCGKKDKTEEATDTAKAEYPLHVGAIAIGETPASQNLALAADTGFRNRSIASGTPDELRITVTEMALKTAEGSSVPIFIDDAGKILSIRSGYVDLSDLFTKIECLDDNGNIIPLDEGQTCECGMNADRELIQKVTVDPRTGEEFDQPSCPSVQPGDKPGVATAVVSQLGTFSSLSMRIKSKGLVKGCVAGHFMYKVADNADDKVHTFCTQADKSLYTSGKDSFTNSDFESVNNSKPAEFMDFALDPSAADYQTQDSIYLTFPIAGGVVIDGETAPQITLGVDLGRVLRFDGLFADHPREEQGKIQSEGARFFPLLPASYQFVFVGKPGQVFGHRWHGAAQVVNTSAEVPADRTCIASNPDGCHMIAGWMTTIFQGDGSPIAFNVMPDDDNALTVLKGGNFSGDIFDTEVFTKKSDLIYDVDYGISSVGSQGLTGTVYGIDYSKAVDSTQDLTFSTTTMTNNKFAFGKLTFERAL